jgi:hypothetical protein
MQRPEAVYSADGEILIIRDRGEDKVEPRLNLENLCENCLDGGCRRET